MSQHDLIGEQIRELGISDVTRIIYQPDFDTRIQIISATVMDWRRGEASC